MPAPRPVAPPPKSTDVAVAEPEVADADAVIAVEPEPVQPVSLRQRLAKARAAFAGAFTGVLGRATITDETWMELEGNHRIAIVFADALAEIVPAEQVRMRRDFRQLLTMVEAVAMLHQCQRGTDADGRILATLDDYEQARTLLIDVFQTAASGGVGWANHAPARCKERVVDDRRA